MAGSFTVFTQLLVLAGIANAIQKQQRIDGASNSRSSNLEQTIIVPQASEVYRKLLICNAYASQQGLGVFNIRQGKPITQRPIKYKECKDMVVPLIDGDRLEFRAGEDGVGIFHATGLPVSNTSLLLIPHRKRPYSLSASFASHAFVDLAKPQVVVLDVYKGAKKSSVKIVDDQDQAPRVQGKILSPPRAEYLEYHSVAAINPGKYKVILDDDSSHLATFTKPLKVTGSQYNVVLRVGVDGDSKGPTAAFPQELMVFQASKSGAGDPQMHLAAVILVASALVSIM